MKKTKQNKMEWMIYLHDMIRKSINLIIDPLIDTFVEEEGE